MSKKKAKRSAVKRRVKVPSTEKLFFVRRQFPHGATYGTIPGDRGRLLRLGNFVKDEQLIRLGYIAEIPDPASIDISECAACGGQFVNMDSRDAHFRRSHADIIKAREKNIEELTEKERQRLLAKDKTFTVEDMYRDKLKEIPGEPNVEAEQQREDQRAPLFMDKTAAARGPGA